MKFTLDWLAEHLETEATVEELAEALTDLGLEVEAVDDLTARLGAFTICRVIDAKPHPNADRLRVCQVETFPEGPKGARKEVQVVCGAPNARTGLVGVFAPPGTHIPGTGIELSKTVIRGVESAGMLCSGKELTISEDHDGIIDLPADAPLGECFADYASIASTTIEIAITPNRPDALGVRGIARDLAARGLGVLKDDPVKNVPGSFANPVSIEIDEAAGTRGCPAFLGRVIRGVSNGRSPEWMQRRLEAIGLRPISALVDITNYVTFDRARPLHVFDADKLSGGLKIHFAADGDRVAALDGDEYELTSGMLAISDDHGPQSIAGIIGGAATGCSEATRNVFLESALWDPLIIAATGRQLKINSDARFRFERGVDPAFARAGLELATEMILEICGGEASDVGQDGHPPVGEHQLKLRGSRVYELVGMDVPADRQIRILDDLGFQPRTDGDSIIATVPSWRPDVRGEADLVEEVARVVSLAGLKSVTMPRRTQGISRPILTSSQQRERAVRMALAADGGHECVTYSFVDSSLGSRFLSQGPVYLQNPVSSEMDLMRADLIPGLLHVLSRNEARGHGDLFLFEVGPVFSGSDPGEQFLQAGGIMAGNADSRRPGRPPRKFDIFDAKAAAESAIEACGWHGGLKCGRDAPDWFHPGRSGSLFVRPGVALGYFGELHPKVTSAARLRSTVYAFSVFIDRIPQPRRRIRARPALDARPLQAVERDFAFLLDEKVEAATVIAAVRSSKFRNCFSEVEVFDEFSGPKASDQFGQGRKSLAISITLQPGDNPFRDAELESISADVVRLVEEKTGGVLRSGSQ